MQLSCISYCTYHSSVQRCTFESTFVVEYENTLFYLRSKVLVQRCLCTTRYTCTVGLQRCTLNVFLFTRRRRRLFLSTCTRTRTCTIVVLGNRMWINTFVGTFVLSYTCTRTYIMYIKAYKVGTSPMYEGMILHQ
jgi:hypothetical protein